MDAHVCCVFVVQAMGIRRYVFMSIFNCDKHPEVPLMNIKAATEEFLKSSGLSHTVLRLCGFHQVRLCCAVLSTKYTCAALCCARNLGAVFSSQASKSHLAFWQSIDANIMHALRKLHGR